MERAYWKDALCTVPRRLDHFLWKNKGNEAFYQEKSWKV